MVLDAAALQVAKLCQCVGLVCCVESEMQAGHSKLVCNESCSALWVPELPCISSCKVRDVKLSKKPDWLYR